MSHLVPPFLDFRQAGLGDSVAGLRVTAAHSCPRFPELLVPAQQLPRGGLRVTSPPKPAETPPVAGAGAGDTPAAADAPRHESPADPSRDEHAPCAGSVQGHTPASSSPGSLQPIDGGDTTSGTTSTVSDRSSSLSPSQQRERRPRGPPLPRLLRRQFRHRGWVYSGEQTRLTSRKRPSGHEQTDPRSPREQWPWPSGLPLRASAR